MPVQSAIKTASGRCGVGTGDFDPFLVVLQGPAGSRSMVHKMFIVSQMPLPLQLPWLDQRKLAGGCGQRIRRIAMRSGWQGRLQRMCGRARIRRSGLTAIHILSQRLETASSTPMAGTPVFSAKDVLRDARR
jgi:hypothetical protein